MTNKFHACLRRLSLLAALICLFIAPLPAAQTPGELKASAICQAQFFDLRDVQLLDGPFKTARDLDVNYLLFLDPDRLLAGVRENSGLPPKAPRYGGWESQGVAGQSLGHYLTAIAQEYRATGDARFRDRLNYIVDQLAECQARNPSGNVAAIPNGRAEFEGLKRRGGRLRGWVPWYTMHKLFAGLRDAYWLGGNEKAREVLIRLADWADSVTKDLTEQEKEVMLGTEHGGMPEVLADVYAITGDPRHLALARRFCHRAVMDPLSRGEDPLNGLHANTQIPKITGAARLYELTGEEYFHNVAGNFWGVVVSNRSYVIGGNSDNEHFFPPDQFSNHLSSGTCETCNTYNMLKLTEHLFEWQPSARSMDYYERALYNHILASQDPATGMFTYFVSLKPGHFKIYSNPTNAFWCCVGTGMENHTKYGRTIYAHNSDTLWVNLFIASEVTWREQGVVLRQETQFPDSDRTRLSLQCAQPQQFTLKVRWPAWAESIDVSVNGQALKVSSRPEDSYVAVAREWRDGDSIEIRLPMSLHTERLPHTTNVNAVLYGPIVLAAELGTNDLEGVSFYQGNHDENIYRNRPVPVAPMFVAANANVLDHIAPVAGKSLTFRTHNLGQPADLTLIPFYRMPHERYSVYFETYTPDGWKNRQVELRAAEERKKAFEARIVDDVRPGEQQSEVDHAFKGARTSSGGSSPKWRDARDGGWFEYRLRVPTGQPAELRVTYWGSDGGNRTFDILVDGEKIATESLTARRPNEFIEQHYSIPASLTEDKTEATVRFVPHRGNFAGGVFGLLLLKGED